MRYEALKKKIITRKQLIKGSDVKNVNGNKWVKRSHMRKNKV